MAVRTLSQIIAELNKATAPQVASLRQRQGLIPGQIATEEQGLQAKQGQAYEDILGGARRRGLGFSGIPLAEQAKYSATEYTPALARLRQTGQENAMSLEDAILGITSGNLKEAQGLRQAELDRREQRRQFNLSLEEQRRARAAASRASAAASAMPSLGSLFAGMEGGGEQNNPNSATAVQRKDKGYNFTNAQGKAISAAQYAAAKGVKFRELLKTMARSGDKGARQALTFVGNDYGYDPRKVTTPQLAKIYNLLVWGTGRKAKPFNPPKSTAPKKYGPQNYLMNPVMNPYRK